MLFQTSAPSNAGQYSDGVGEANTEGVFYTVSWNEQATTPLNDRSSSRPTARRTRARPRPRTRPTRSPPPRCCRQRVEAVGAIDQDKIRDWLHGNEVQTILGPLSWNDKGEPQGDFILAQWQSGKVQVVGPPDAATTDTIVYPKPRGSDRLTAGGGAVSPSCPTSTTGLLHLRTCPPTSRLRQLRA